MFLPWLSKDEDSLTLTCLPISTHLCRFVQGHTSLCLMASFPKDRSIFFPQREWEMITWWIGWMGSCGLILWEQPTEVTCSLIQDSQKLLVRALWLKKPKKPFPHKGDSYGSLLYDSLLYTCSYYISLIDRYRISRWECLLYYMRGALGRHVFQNLKCNIEKNRKRETRKKWRLLLWLPLKSNSYAIVLVDTAQRLRKKMTSRIMADLQCLHI